MEVSGALAESRPDPAEPGAVQAADARSRLHHVRVLIAPERRWPRIDLRELWAYRSLMLFLVWRDIKVRYAQTVLGASWAILQPVLATVVFTVVFGRFARMPSDGVPYSVFALSGLVPWTYFSTALNGAGNSLVSNTNLVTKVYFPRLVTPVAPILAAFVDFLIAFVVLLVVMFAMHVVPSPHALLLIPLVLASAAGTALGVGCWLAALNIQYRDVKHATPFLLQLWMYSSPVVYPLSLLPHRLQAIAALNPMVGVISGFRAALLGTPMPWEIVAVSGGVAITLLVSGALFFRSRERIFADVA